jgi:hypothetical protein
VISRPRKIITRSFAEDMNSIPVVANISSAKYSPTGRDSSSTQRSDINTVKNVTIRKIIEKHNLKLSVIIIPLKDVSPLPPHRLATANAAPVRPSRETIPATRRSMFRATASIIIISTATEAVIVSGRIA